MAKARSGKEEMMPIKLKDIKPPVTIEWDVTLDANRGSIKTYRERILEKHYSNLRTETDWLWWPKIKNCNVRIIEAAVESETVIVK